MCSNIFAFSSRASYDEKAMFSLKKTSAKPETPTPIGLVLNDEYFASLVG